jgi:predicted nucleotidyltransferase component of viral defense system
MKSEIPPTVQIRLKVEINCFEHFNVLGLVKHPFEVKNSWFSGKADLTTYQYNELLGTKLRALYQRKKGRDLFDLYIALAHGECNAGEIVQCYKKYMAFVVEKPPTRKQFINNMELKMQDVEFLGDTVNLLRPELIYNPNEAYKLVKEQLIDKLQ